MDDIHEALRAKEAQLRAIKDAANRMSVAEAQQKLDHALRSHIGGAYLTGIDPNMAANDNNFWVVAQNYYRGLLLPGNRRSASKPDFEVRTTPNPLQPYLDRLQRRTR